MQLNDQKWLDEMEQKILVMLMINVFFACWLLIPEQIL